MKSIKIVYEWINHNGNNCIDIATIQFSNKTTEYVETLSYKDNMEAMIYDILENGFVFVNDSLAVPIFNIRQYMVNEEIVKKEESIPKENINKNKDGKKWKPIHHGKKIHGRIGHPRNQNVPIAPVKPEEILKQSNEQNATGEINVVSKTNEIGEIC